MANPSVEEVWNDPDFQGLPMEERRKVLIQIDPDFKGLPSAEQDQVLGVQTVQTATSPKFYELEKQPGVPRGPMELLKQVGRQYKEAAMSPMPGSIITAPIRATQENAQQVGAEVARGFSTPGGFLPNIGKIPARAAGFAASVATDPTSYLGGAINVGKAIVPAERLMSVQAAKKAGIPLTRADVTGGRLASSIESGLEKTMTGSQPIQDVRTAQLTKFGSFLDELDSLHGTKESPNVVGQTVQSAANDVARTVKGTAQSLYKQVPNLPVPLKNLKQLSDNIVKNQSRLPSVNQDPALIEAASQYSDLANKSIKYVDEWGRKNKSVPMQESPVSLDVLRSVQSDASAKSAQLHGTEAGRSWAKIAHAIDEDIKALERSDNPLTKYLGKEVNSKLTGANTLWKGMKDLENSSLVKSIRLSKPEDVADKIFKNGNVSDVLTARKAIGDDGFKAAKQQYFSQLIKDPKLAQKLDKADPEFLKLVFNQAELADLYKAVAIRKLLGTAEKMGGQAGSARSNAISLQGAGVGAGLGTTLTGVVTLNPAAVVTGLGMAGTAYFGPRMAANAYLNKGLSGVNIPVAAPGLGQTAHRGQPRVNPLDIIRRAIRSR